MSKNSDDTDRLKDVLRGISVISTVRKRDDFFELLVPSMEVPAAHKAIIDMEI